MSRSLLAFDTDRIKEYVFATDPLKEIRGASRLLDTLNRKDMPWLAGGTCYYAHGGSGLFVVPTSDVAAIVDRVKRAYVESTAGAATITGAAVPLPPDFDETRDDVRPLWRQLGYKLAAEKACNAPMRASITHPLLQHGATDGDFYATEEAEDGRLISRVSAAKRERGTAGGAKDFDTIASFSSPPNYFALVYADGDGLGETLSSCRTLSEIRRVAQGIDEILDEARRRATSDLDDQQYDVLLSGGDDLVLAISAQYALGAALEIAEYFSRETAERLGLPMTLSTAIVWSHTSFPFGTWLDITESVLKFAKRQGAKRGLSGLINFLVVSSANHLDFQQFYREVLLSKETTLRHVVRTMRPYTSDALRALISYRTDPAKLRDMPRSKLEALRRAIFQSSSQQALLEALRVLVHWRGEQTRKVVRDLVDDYIGSAGSPVFPFAAFEEPSADPDETLTVYRTPIADLAELWDFIL